MTYAAQLIDVVKQNPLLDSDRKLGSRLGVSGPTISQWRHGVGSPMSAERVVELCELANIAEADQGYWLTGVQRDAVTVTSVRRALDVVLDRLRPIVATVGLVTVGSLGGFALSSSASGKTHGNQAPAGSTTHSLYIMFNRWRGAFTPRRLGSIRQHA